MSIGGLPTLSPEVAEAIARHKGTLRVRYLTKLSVKAARALAKHKDGLELDGSLMMSDETAEALRANPGISFPEKYR